MGLNQSPTDFWLVLSARFYQSLIFVLPKEFRQNYASEMTQVFRDCCRDAYRRKGTVGVLGQFIGSVGDLIISGLKERITSLVNNDSHLLLLFTVSLAITAGLIAGFLDLKNDDVQGPVLLLMVFSFFLGMIRPKSFWLSAILVGLMMPTVHFIARFKGLNVNYATDASTPFWSFLALLPAFIGAGSGALFRTVLSLVRSRH